MLSSAHKLSLRRREEEEEEEYQTTRLEDQRYQPSVLLACQLRVSNQFVSFQVLKERLNLVAGLGKSVLPA